MQEVKKYVPFAEICTRDCYDTESVQCVVNSVCLGRVEKGKALTLEEIVERGGLNIVNWLNRHEGLSSINKTVIAVLSRDIAKAFVEEFICKENPK